MAAACSASNPRRQTQDGAPPAPGGYWSCGCAHVSDNRGENHSYRLVARGGRLVPLATRGIATAWQYSDSAGRRAAGERDPRRVGWRGRARGEPMKQVEPEVFLVARPQVDYDGVAAYLHAVGGQRWLERLDRDQLDEGADSPQIDAQNLAEIAGRMCYRSWEPGLNPNVTRVRTDQAEYLQNVLRSGHGSVLEHV